MRDRRRVIYLGGLGRSGTTLLERLLAELPGVSALGEVVHLWQRGVAEDERCGCGAQFSACEFWTRVGKAAFDGWDKISVPRFAELREAVDRTRFIPRLARGLAAPGSPRQGLAARGRDQHGLPGRPGAALSEYTDYYVRVYAAAAEVAGAEAVVDSSKHASLAFCLATRPEIDLRVVHVVRDSRAVAYSWTTRVARPDASSVSYMTTYGPARAAAQWNAENGALELLARRGTPVLRVRYEDLVAAPGPTVRRVAEFAGLPAGDAALGFLRPGERGMCATLHEAHTASGNPMRFATGAIAIRGDQRWQTEMPASGRRLVTAMTLPLLRRYGYLGPVSAGGSR